MKDNILFIKKHYVLLVLFFILVVAGFFRFYKLNSVPPNTSLDEVTIGWNAYSIMLTGRDEYKTFIPVLLRAYDDYRPALYVYLVIPFVKAFGLSVTSVRLPAVILSLATVLATFYLVREMFLKYKLHNVLALLSAFLLAISPWHIYISRLGHEANPGSAFSIFGILFFILAVKRLEKKYFIYISGLFFSLSAYTYQSEKVFGPLIILALICLFHKELWKIKKHVLFTLLCAIILILPMLWALLQPQSLIRFKATTAFNSYNKAYQQSALRLEDDVKTRNYIGLVLDNRRITTVKIFLANYFSHFNPYWLFTYEQDSRFKVPGFGLLYVWTLPFILIGIFCLLFKKFDRRTKALLIIWFFSSFIAPAITADVPHAMRAFNVLPVFQILTALGILGIFDWMYGYTGKKKYLFYLLSVAFSMIVILFVQNFYLQYFYTFPKQDSQEFQYALTQALTQYVIPNDKKYKKIIMSNQRNLYQSYMFFLFYSKYNPMKYQRLGGTISGGYNETHRFDKYEFRTINLLNERKTSDILYVGNPNTFPPNQKYLYLAKYLDGSVGVKVVRGN